MQACGRCAKVRTHKLGAEPLRDPCPVGAFHAYAAFLPLLTPRLRVAVCCPRSSPLVPESICVSWDTIYGSKLPSSCTASRAVGVITLIVGGAALLCWIALVGVQLLGGGSSLTDPTDIRSVRKRKLRLVLIASGLHWFAALFAVVTCFSMKNFLTEAGLLAEGHWSYCLPLFVMGVIAQISVPCLLRFTLDTNLDR